MFSNHEQQYILLTYFLCRYMSNNCFFLQADTTDTEYRQGDGRTRQEFMDFLEGPEARQRALSIASVITSTMEGGYCTPGHRMSTDKKNKALRRFDFFVLVFTRAGGVATEVSSVLVQFCRNLPHLEMLSSVDEDQEGGQPNSDGSICGLKCHHLHCTEHVVHGHGTLSNVSWLQQNAVCGQCGE